MKELGVSKVNYDDLYDFDDIHDDFFDLECENEQLSRPKYNPDNRLRSNKTTHRPTIAVKRSDTVIIPTPKVRHTETTCKDLYGNSNRLLPDINRRHLIQQDVRPKVVPEINASCKTRLPDIHMTSGTRHHEVYGSFTPKPPCTPKPNENQQRRNLYRSNQLDQDISVHNPSLNYHKIKLPCTPEYNEIDYDKEIDLATKMQKEFEAYHQSLNEMKKSSLKPGDAEYQRLLESGSSNQINKVDSETTIDTTRCNQHRKPWHAVDTRRGVGFKSKIKNDKKVKY
ncbi:hypothetical protein ACF0H5_005804 [Mactra antiquata]